MKKQLLILLLAALLLVPGCETKKPSAAEEGDYVLYFLSELGHGPALVGQPWKEAGEDVQAEEMLRALLAGPAQEGLRSPFPRGVSLRGCSFDEEREGVLQVWLTEQYSGLSDISLTLADYCIVLTLAQLDGVEGVEILSGRHSINYRSHQVLSAAEAMLTDPLAG